MSSLEKIVLIVSLAAIGGATKVGVSYVESRAEVELVRESAGRPVNISVRRETTREVTDGCDVGSLPKVSRDATGKEVAERKH